MYQEFNKACELNSDDHILNDILGDFEFNHVMINWVGVLVFR